MPNEIIYETKQYLLFHVFSYFALSIASYMLIVANGTGGVVRILIGNIINSCGSLLSAFVLIHCFHMGVLGPAL